VVVCGCSSPTGAWRSCLATKESGIGSEDAVMFVSVLTTVVEEVSSYSQEAYHVDPTQTRAKEHTYSNSASPAPQTAVTE